MTITPQQYQALCVVIDAVKTDERSEDTDMYASRILDALNLTIERTQAMTQGGHRTPAEMLEDYDAGCMGTKDIDMRAILHEMLLDVQDSYTKAMLAHGASAVTAGVVTDEVTSYIINHYGDK